MATIDMTEKDDRGFNSFSGADITCFFNHKRVATLMALTVSVTREIQPIYVLGSEEAKAFSKGKRGIAGSLVFSQFDRDALIDGIFGADTKNYSERFDIQKRLSNIDKDRFSNTLSTTDSNINFQLEAAAIQGLLAKKKLEYADQLPPFTITVTMTNDEGAASVAAIYGVQLINQGFGWSLDDITNEVAYTFVARRITPVTSLIASSANANEWFTDEKY